MGPLRPCFPIPNDDAPHGVIEQDEDRHDLPNVFEPDGMPCHYEHPYASESLVDVV